MHKIKRCKMYYQNYKMWKEWSKNVKFWNVFKIKLLPT